ncbi:uncharacterized protein LOC110989951 isoform X2 [Acanthaster planci]|uniref:Netrin receptor UNC5 n=1 Tax=Acanthaster planci TaxID=133434 RepID=A0A8B7ZY74_ACAPL|nr:uncharacterized protein LOC110989951 isoform X2 [Acanthaster planci]
MILDEYHSQTSDFSDEELLDTCFQLPYIAIGHFNESGGSLSLDNYGVHLTIPPGAIPPGPPQEVYIYVDPSALLTDGDDPTKIALSRRVKCGPTGLKFAESVVLSFPHQADVTSMDPKGFSARMCQDDDSSKTWEEFDENLVVVTKDRVILFVNHFTWYALEFLMKLMSLGSSSKRLLVAAYGDNFVRNGRTYQFRVWVLNDDEAVKKNVEADEKLNRLDGFRNLLFRWGGGGVYVKLSQFPDGCQVPEGEEQIIDETKISNHPSNSVTFTLRQLSKLHGGDDLYCSVETYQKRADGDSRKQSKSCLSICAAIKTENCAEMTARDRGVAVGNAALMQSTSSIGAESNGTTTSLQDEIKNGFSKRRREGNGHCGDPKKSFDLYKEVQQQLKGQNGSGDSCRIFVTLHSDQVLCIQKPGIRREITPTECNKIVQEITRQHVAPNHGVTELQVSKKEEIMSDRKGIKDSTLRLFSKELGAEWEALATFLGFSSPDIYQFKNDNPHDTSNQIFQMLVGWRDERYPEALVNTLKTNIVEIYGVDIEIGLDDSSLQEVSLALGPEWEALATSLGFSETDILEIKDSQDQILKVLLGWRNKQLSPEAQLEWLCCELKKIDREDLADKLRGMDGFIIFVFILCSFIYWCYIFAAFVLLK